MTTQMTAEQMGRILYEQAVEEAKEASERLEKRLAEVKVELEELQKTKKQTDAFVVALCNKFGFAEKKVV